MKALRNKKGFTLVELIVTIAILSVLVLLAVPRFGGHIQDVQLTKGIANAKSIENASRLYYMDNDDWPRLTDDPYTDEELKDFSDRIYDITGKEVDIDPDGNYYNIDYNKLDKYVKISDDKRNYILQNPVGKIFYMENLSEEGLSRVSYANESGPELPNEEIVYEFSNAGLLGRLGPTQSQLDIAYSGTSLAGKVNSDNGTQVWTVPKSGIYKIEAYGAQGGSSNDYRYKGGLGAVLSGEFHITKGSELRIIVGQTVVNEDYAPGGGASGAWISNSDTPMIIAGGGGGANNLRNSKSGGNANLTTDGGSSDGAGGKNGSGGQANFITGAGAGWLTDGQSRTSDGGTALKKGAQGGSGYSTSYDGGFGGGGGGFGGGGGGGGYSGGGSGNYKESLSFGGGGGSYNSGANQANSVENTGHGKVIITYMGE